MNKEKNKKITISYNTFRRDCFSNEITKACQRNKEENAKRIKQEKGGVS